MLGDHVHGALSLIPQEYNNLEVEARFGSYDERGNFNSRVSWSYFNQLRDTLRKVVGETEIKETSNVSQYANGMRGIMYTPQKDQVTPYRVEWIQKFRVHDHIEYPQYGVRVAFSQETILDPTPEQIKALPAPESQRQRVRYTYILDDVRIDLTDVTIIDEDSSSRRGRQFIGPQSSSQGPQDENILGCATEIEPREMGRRVRHVYEVEAELVNARDLDAAKRFDSVVVRIFKWLYDTHEVYTEMERLECVEYLNRMLGGDLVRREEKEREYSEKTGTPLQVRRNRNVDSSVIVQARNLKMRDLVWGGLVGGDVTYTVTVKADGLRKLLIFMPRAVWLVYPPHEFNLVMRLDGDLGAFTGTVIDGELIPPERRRKNSAGDAPGAYEATYLFIPFDLIAFRGDTEIRNRNHGERIGAIYDNLIRDDDNTFRSNLLFLYAKSFTHITGVDAFFEIMRNLLPQLANKAIIYEDDGLIFTPENAPYNSFSDIYPLSDRSLKRHPDVCKWKPPEKLTIDFLISKSGSGTPCLYSFDRDPLVRKYVTFSGSKINPFVPTMVEANSPLLEDVGGQVIVEYKWDGERFVPLRIRTNKTRPNALDVAVDIWEDINNPITTDTLMGLTNALVRAYHNRIKRKLLLTVAGDALDIGSGVGGDSSKWFMTGSRLTWVGAVEPEAKNRTKLLKRLALQNIQDRVLVLPVGAQDTEVIVESLRSAGHPQVQVAILFLSLTFFWKDAATLDALVNTLDRVVAPGGTILYFVLDGDAVRELFEPSFTEIRLQARQMGPIRMVLEPETEPPNGRPLFVSIPGPTAEGHTEYLVRLSDLTTRLRSRGFSRPTITRATQERFLTSPEREYTSLYIYGSYQRGPSPTPLTPSEPPKTTTAFPRLPPSAPISRTTPAAPSVSVAPAPSVPATPAPPVPVVPVPEVKKVVEKSLPYLQVIPAGPREPAINDDKYQEVPCPWYPTEEMRGSEGEVQVVRIANLGGGSCFIHAVCKAMYPKYQEAGTSGERIEIAKKIRRDLAYCLSLNNPEFPGHTYWATVANGAFPRLLLQQIKSPDLIVDVDYSPTGLAALFNSQAYLGDEVYSFVALILELDIYVVRGTTLTIHPHFSTSRVDRRLPSIVIMGATEHYETVGILHPSLGIQTLFDPDDPFIIALRSQPGGQFQASTEEYDPDQTLAEEILETFTDPDTGSLEFPPKITTWFPPSSLFRSILDRILASLGKQLT